MDKGTKESLDTRRSAFTDQFSSYGVFGKDFTDTSWFGVCNMVGWLLARDDHGGAMTIMVGDHGGSMTIMVDP